MNKKSTVQSSKIQGCLGCLAVALGGADCGPFEAFIKDELSDVRAEMAFARVEFSLTIAELADLIEQPVRPRIKKRIDEVVLRGVELFPDIFEADLVYIADDDAAARAAKDIAERVDMHAFCAEKIRFAIHRSESLCRFCSEKFGQFSGGTAGEPAGIIVNGGDVAFLAFGG